MDLKLKNKNALIFASSEGIGQAIAAGLFQEGANICLASRSSDKLKRAHDLILASGAQGKLVYTVCDLSNTTDIDATVNFAVEKMGGIDILVNNQGGPPPGAFSAISDDQIQAAIQTNLLSVILAIRLCLPNMEKNKWGRIINVLSISAKEPIPNMFLSNLIRPAVLGLSKTIAQEKARAGVTINSILPSAVLTERSRGFVEKKASSENKTFEIALKEIGAGIPSGYLAAPEEVAAIAVFLASESASYINGDAIAVDGASSKCLF